MKNKCLGVFLVFVTIPLMILSIFSISSTRFFASNYYKKLLQKTESYNHAVKVIPKESDNDIMKAIFKSIDEKWLKTNLEKNLDGYFAFMNGKADTPVISVDVTVIKKNLPTNLGSDFINAVPNELTFDGYKSLIGKMKDQTATLAKLDPTASGNLSDYDAQIQQTNKMKEQLDNNFSSMRTGYNYYKYGMYVIFGLTILMLVVIALAARHYFPAIFRWLGQTLFISGILTLITVLSIQYILNYFKPLDGLSLSNDLKTLIIPAFNYVVKDYFGAAGKISIVVSSIGLISVIFSYIIAKYVPEPKPAPEKQ